MYVYGNNLTGTIPAALGSLPTAVSKALALDLCDNVLAGTVPAALSGSFQSLSLSYNPQLVGPLPAGIPLWKGVSCGFSLMGTSIGLDRRAAAGEEPRPHGERQR